MNQDLSSQTLREWLSAKPYTLAMSSGFFGFYAHAGFLQAIESSGIKPRAIRGSSAGALVGALWAAGLGADAIVKNLSELKRTDFWDPYPGVGFLRGKKFAEKLAEILPVHSFDQCRVPMHVSVFDPIGRKTVTLKTGSLVTAIRASCAVPLMFHPVWTGSRPYFDGGILDRPGINEAHADERILYHHLLPQSVWRRKQALSSQIPDRASLRSVAIPNLPSVNPFRLASGKQALIQAYEYTMKILDIRTPEPG